MRVCTTQFMMRFLCELNGIGSSWSSNRCVSISNKYNCKTHRRLHVTNDVNVVESVLRLVQFLLYVSVSVVLVGVEQVRVYFVLDFEFDIE